MIIDVRNRPPAPEFEPFFNMDITKWINGRLQVETPAPFESQSVPDWAAEIRDSPIDKVAVVSRNTPSCQIPNTVIADLRERYADIIIGVAGIDIAGTVHDPVKELEYCVSELEIYAAAVDPGTSGGSQDRVWGSQMDDARFYEFYHACSDLDVPLFMMTGPFSGRNYSYCNPERLDHLLGDFPNLKIIAGHGCYPYVTESIAVGYKRENLFISPDCYMFAPGATPYVEAAEGMLRDQMMFGTAYPFAPVSLVERSASLGLSEAAMSAYMGDNAAQLFKRSLG